MCLKIHNVPRTEWKPSRLKQCCKRSSLWRGTQSLKRRSLPPNVSRLHETYSSIYSFTHIQKLRDSLIQSSKKSHMLNTKMRRFLAPDLNIIWKLMSTVHTLNFLKPTGYVMHQQFNLIKPTGYVMHRSLTFQRLLVTWCTSILTL